MIMHKDTEVNTATTTEYIDKVEDLECNLRWCQMEFANSKPINKAKEAATTLYKITEILANKIPLKTVI
jgi:hypothetical protein